MEDLKNKIINFWDSFETKEGYRLFSPDIALDLSLGYTDNAEKAVLILTKDFRIRDEFISESENIILRFENNVGFYLILKDDFFFQIFVDFIVSVLDQVSNLQHPSDFVPKIITIFNNWVAFLNRKKNKKLNNKKLLGLIGELFFISEATRNENSSLDAVAFWEGPNLKSHDFVFPEFDVEIKTKSSTSNNVSISSIKQLEYNNPLFLGIVDISIIDKVEDQTITVFKFIDDLKQTIINKGLDQSMFLNKLLSSGINYYDEETQRKLKEIGFVIQGVEFYDVTKEGFPRLINSDLPKGITNIKYDLVVSDLATYKTTFSWN